MSLIVCETLGEYFGERQKSVSELTVTQRLLPAEGLCLSWILIVFLSWLPISASKGELPPLAISKLGSSSFYDREEGQSELLQWGRLSPNVAKTELLTRTRTDQEPEVRARCMEVLHELVIDDYLRDGDGYIGIALSQEMGRVPQDPKLRSVIRVTQVQPNTPASRAEILVGDFIVGLNREIWYDADAYVNFLETIKRLKPNTKVSLQIMRVGVVSDVLVTLMRRPSALGAPLFLNPTAADLEGSERAAKEAYFREWMRQRTEQK